MSYPEPPTASERPSLTSSLPSCGLRSRPLLMSSLLFCGLSRRPLLAWCLPSFGLQRRPLQTSSLPSCGLRGRPLLTSSLITLSSLTTYFYLFELKNSQSTLRYFLTKSMYWNILWLGYTFNFKKKKGKICLFVKRIAKYFHKSRLRTIGSRNTLRKSIDLKSLSLR